MNTLENYTREFFSTLTMDADLNGHNYKMLLSEAIYDFLAEPNKKKAYAVYSMFFDVYRTSAESKKSFVDLLDMLRGYEEQASTLSDGQRDHYVHSVNVFVLGLCIYSQNRIVRDAFDREYDHEAYIRAFHGNQEEFLFSWGTASLFHDIGYPLEIINNQMQKFIAFVADKDKKEIGPFISYTDFEKFNGFASEKRNDVVFRPTDLMAEDIRKHLKTDLVCTKQTVNGFLEVMQKNGFVDHGFYSAIIVLRWYGELLVGHDEVESIYFNQIVNAATAIFMHNAYKNIFQKAPYSLQELNVFAFPLAYLLILCDEAQEWNREAYGIKVKSSLAVDDSAVVIDDNKISFHYVTNKGLLEESFLEKKQALFYRLLDIEPVFPSGLKVTSTTKTDQFISLVKKSEVLPRLLVSNIEELAIKIHNNYNEQQLLRNPDRVLEYPTWDSLPDTLKYSNVRQAQSIVEKLSWIDCFVEEKSVGKEYVLTEDEVELLAVVEHDLWVEERKSNGWKYGEVKDPNKKTSPYLVPYDELSEEIKELDRDTVRNIPSLLDSVGLCIVKNQ